MMNYDPIKIVIPIRCKTLHSFWHLPEKVSDRFFHTWWDVIIWLMITWGLFVLLICAYALIIFFMVPRGSLFDQTDVGILIVSVFEFTTMCYILDTFKIDCIRD